MKTVFIANRGEIAVRIAQAVAELGLESVAVHAEDEPDGLHLRYANRTHSLKGTGARAYLDGAGLVQAAVETGCDAVHPGYGFLSESAEFAEQVADAGLIFIGPEPDILRRLGDKVAARQLAQSVGVPTIPGLETASSQADVEVFMDQQPGPVVLKAVAGGGGRGMRVIKALGDLPDAWESARREAKVAFGDDRLFVERFVARARHIEVQIIGDGVAVAHAWERDCSIQRRHQKIIEIAPAPGLVDNIRSALLSASMKMASEAGYRGLGTFEFLVEPGGEWYFIETNPRLQVEHTVTEAVTGLDLVQAQIQISGGSTLAELGLSATPDKPSGFAIQARVLMEHLSEDGTLRPTSGTLSVYQPPGGVGVRVDGQGHVGFTASPLYDNLLAKLICHSTGAFGDAVARTRNALQRFDITGLSTNKDFLLAILDLPEIQDGAMHTRLVDERLKYLALAAVGRGGTGKSVDAAVTDGDADPLAILNVGASKDGAAAKPVERGEGAVLAPMAGTVQAIKCAVGEAVSAGAVVAVLEAMKMHHSVRAPVSGTIVAVSATADQTVGEGNLLMEIAPSESATSVSHVAEAIDLDEIRPDLRDLQDRKALLLDSARPDAVAKRHKLGKSTARENVSQLCDPGSFIEYGDLTFAAQRARRTVDDLMRNTPADGLITGFGTVNADQFGEAKSRVAVLAYDYTVLAGTQGLMNHTKKDRIFTVIEKQQTPVVMFCEGGGGRPGDVDAGDTSIAGLYCTTFAQNARLSGLVPMVGIGSGRLFAGNAALLGCCDVIIATRDASIGMGGPAMIEGGGLGVFRPEEVGPTGDQYPNGVIDILVEDEDEAVAAAKRYLAYFQGDAPEWQEPDTRRLRHVVPENRLEVYDSRSAIEALADAGSVTELRGGFAPGMVTALARISGRTVGVLANNPVHLAGAIDSDGADKAARFIGLCDAFDIPLLTLIDTPGMMVGPDVEKTALVRHCSRVFLAGANAEIPILSVILRKSYGLGAQAMAGGSFRQPLFIVGWPTAEIGAMGLEGAVKLGYRKELEAIESGPKRQELFERMVAEAYERGKAVNAASVLEFDTVIDPADTRRWVVATLDAVPDIPPRRGKKRPFVDAW